MNKLIVIPFAIAAMFPVALMAEEDNFDYSLVVHGVSHHSKSGYVTAEKKDDDWTHFSHHSYNEVNAGLAGEISKPAQDNWKQFARIGFYEDSYSKTAYYGGVGIRGKWNLYGDFHVGFNTMLGWLNGSGREKEIVLVPALELGYNRYTIEVVYAPDPKVDVIAASLRIDF